MKIEDVRKSAFAMPLTSPAFPRPPYRFYNREYIVIKYRTDREALEAVVPEPLEVPDPIVNFEFIRMPDSTGFGDYTECGQVIPVRYQGRDGGYVHSMYLNDESPIAGGREIWGFPKKLADPKITHESDVIVGTLNYGSVACAVGSMGYKHKIIDPAPLLESLRQPNFMLKIIPHVDGSPRICELVEYYLEDVELLGAWSAPAALALHSHVAADVARLPVREIVAATHFIANLNLGLGKVVFDYLADDAGAKVTTGPLRLNSRPRTDLIL